MKKYGLFACLFLSMPVAAYQGATLEFTKTIFSKSLMHGLSDKLKEDDGTKYDCVSDRITPISDKLAQAHINATLSKDEIKLIDDLFDTPYGKDMLEVLNQGNLDNFANNFDYNNYNDKDYIKYETAFYKLSQDHTWVSDDELMTEIMLALVMCGLLDSDEL